MVDGHLNAKFELNSHSATCFGYVNSSSSPVKLHRNVHTTVYAIFVQKYVDKLAVRSVSIAVGLHNLLIT